jgi:hypothetical protein
LEILIVYFTLLYKTWLDGIPQLNGSQKCACCQTKDFVHAQHL